MSRWVLCLIIALSICICISRVGFAQSKNIPSPGAGISQMIESRKGQISCWGVVIQLGFMKFKETLNPDQIEITEAKHSHDLRDIMDWRVEKSGKKLVIEFKPEMGDFGSGNRVEVKINRSAFIEPIESGNNHFSWSIDTDIM